MIIAEQTLRTLFDPRGRADRTEMLVGAVIVLGLELALVLLGADDGVLALGVKCLALWVGVTVSSKRLHDLGRSAWWLAGGLAVLCIWTAFVAFGFLIFLGPAELSQGSAGLLVLMGFVLMPIVGSALWLHVSEGDAEENAYGPPRTTAAPKLSSATA